MSALEGIADELAEAVHVADVPKADISERKTFGTAGAIGKGGTGAQGIADSLASVIFC